MARSDTHLSRDEKNPKRILDFDRNLVLKNGLAFQAVQPGRSNRAVTFQLLTSSSMRKAEKQILPGLWYTRVVVGP